MSIESDLREQRELEIRKQNHELVLRLITRGSVLAAVLIMTMATCSVMLHDPPTSAEYKNNQVARMACIQAGMTWDDNECHKDD